jgi:hypothetical protein
MLEYARTPLEKKCISKDSSTDQHKTNNFYNSRTKFMEFGSFLCGEGIMNQTLEVPWEFVAESRKMTVTDRVKRYSRVDWLSKQSLCYEDRKNVKLYSFVVKYGLAYSFNLDEDLFDKTT